MLCDNNCHVVETRVETRDATRVTMMEVQLVTQITNYSLMNKFGTGVSHEHLLFIFMWCILNALYVMVRIFSITN